MINHITILITYYEAPEMLKEQIKFWRDYPKSVSVVLVDDGSILYPADHVIEDKMRPNFWLYRVKEDIYQNLAGARNLAFAVAPEGWVWCVDIDHVVPAESLENLIKMDLNPLKYYTPGRQLRKIDGTLTPMVPHSDTFIMTKRLFGMTGGYDEDFAQYYYRGSLFMFREALNRVSKKELLQGVSTIFYPSSIISDSSPLQDQERKKFDGLRPPDKKPSVLNFDWEKVW